MSGQPEPGGEAEVISSSIRDRLGDKSIVLVGIMGAGKTTVGRRLADRLNLPFVDADIEIEAAAQRTIPEIFELFGEDYFRDGECRVITRLLTRGPQIMATGGGAFMNSKIRDNIGERGISIWLKADFDTLMMRLKRRGDRPLLQNGDPKDTMRRLIGERYPIYGLADIAISSGNTPHDRVVDDIIAALDARMPLSQTGARRSKRKKEC